VRLVVSLLRLPRSLTKQAHTNMVTRPICSLALRTVSPVNLIKLISCGCNPTHRLSNTLKTLQGRGQATSVGRACLLMPTTSSFMFSSSFIELNGTT